MPWYRIGTVSTVQGSTAVTGVDTLWQSQIKAGDMFTTDGGGKFYEVAVVNSNTSITLQMPFLESAVIAGSYAIIRNFTSTLSADLAARVAALIQTFQESLDYSLAGNFEDGTASAPGIAFQTETSTGLWRPSAKIMAISIFGVEKLRLTETALTLSGVSVTAPSMTVSGALTVAGNVCGSSTGSAYTIGANPQASVTSGGFFQVYGSTSGSGAVAVMGAGGAQVINVSASGASVTGTLGVSGTTTLASGSANHIRVIGGATSGIPYLSFEGSDTNVNAGYSTKGSGGHCFWTGGLTTQLFISHTASANRYVTITGSNGGNPTISTSGGDLSVGTGLIVQNINAGSTGGAYTIGTDPGYATGARIIMYGSTSAHADTTDLAASVVRVPNISTTASAANAFLNSGAANSMLRSTSTRAAKNIIRSMALEDAEKTLVLEPCFYTSKSAADDPHRVFAGFIAEDADAAGLDWLPTYGPDGKPDWFQYERMSTAHHVLIKHLLAETETMKARVAQLENN